MKCRTERQDGDCGGTQVEKGSRLLRDGLLYIKLSIKNVHSVCAYVCVCVCVTARNKEEAGVLNLRMLPLPTSPENKERKGRERERVEAQGLRF